MLKGPALKSSNLHILVLYYNCRTYDDNIGPKFKKPNFAILGAYSMFKNKLYWYRSEVCPEIGKITSLLACFVYFWTNLGPILFY